MEEIGAQATDSYVFDIDDLVTDACQVTYVDENAPLADRTETEIWYNRTVFAGDSLNPAKIEQFPDLAELRYCGTTDVDSLSNGYRRAHSWEQKNDYVLTVGHDLRYLKQELNEVSDSPTRGFGQRIVDRNSTIRRSFSVNPGLFAEYRE